MKKIYKTPLFERFAECMKNQFPTFKLIPSLEKSHLYSHGQHFVEEVTPLHWLFISVLPDPRSGHDSFSLEIGWSRHARISETTDGRAALNFKMEWMDKPEFNCYLVGEDQVGAWYFERTFDPLPHQLSGLAVTVEVAKAVVDPIVDHAIDILNRDGAPILAKMRNRFLAGN